MSASEKTKRTFEILHNPKRGLIEILYLYDEKGEAENRRQADWVTSELLEIIKSAPDQSWCILADISTIFGATMTDYVKGLYEKIVLDDKIKLIAIISEDQINQHQVSDWVKVKFQSKGIHKIKVFQRRLDAYLWLVQNKFLDFI